MVRLSVELINDSYQFINAVKQRELSLRNVQIPAIENLGATRDQFDVVDLSDNNIRKLDNLPLLKRLESLILHNNRIQQIQKDIDEMLPNLKWMVLTNNNLTELGDIDPLAGCPKLEYLTLMGNPLTHKPNYRLYVIFKVKSLRVLDYRRIRDAEREAAIKLFKGKKGAKARAEIKTSKPLPEEDEKAKIAQVKARPSEEQQKIKEAIKSAKTLAEVEQLQSLLLTGKLPTDAASGDTTNGIEMETEE
uniref:Probable U2 small nuclear ribonucleoprotein A' n=1 Tax=Acrobeloides nanus TaxID=290746 RepID=A0A914DQ97_9BILA